MASHQDVFHTSPGFHITLEAHLEGHTGEIESVRFAPDGSFLASCDHKTLRMWHQNEQREWYQQSCLPIPARSLAFAPDGCRVVVVNEDESIEVWTTGGIQLAILLQKEQRGRDAAFSSDGSFIVTSDAQAHITFWSVNTLQIAFESDCTLVEPGSHPWGPTFFALAPNGKRLALLYPNPQGLVHIWEVDPNRQHLFRVKSLLDLQQKLAVPSYSPDGKVLALVESEKRCIWLFHAETFQSQGRVSASQELGSLCYSPDSQFFASDLLGGRVCIWSTGTHQMVASFAAHPDLWTEQASAIGSLDWSPRGDRLVTGGASAFLHDPLRNDFSLKIWRVQRISERS